MAMIMITHDFGVISQMADYIYVMYAGRCMEYGTKEDLLVHPRHPYTVGLIQSVPAIESRQIERLKTIPGFPPDMLKLPPGCPFAPRCTKATDQCKQQMPELKETDQGHRVACYYPY